MKRKQGFFLFLASCIPGCGQMHQGYMKRGLSLMTVFWGVFAAALLLQLEALILLLIPAWLYAFFDSYNLHGQSDAQAAANPDGFLFDLPTVDSGRLAALSRGRHSILGWVLVALGLWMLYSSFAQRLLDVLEYYFDVESWLYSLLLYDIPRIVVTLGIIALGVWFIRGPRKAPPAEDIPAFTPPAGQVRAEPAHPEAEREQAPTTPLTEPEQTPQTPQAEQQVPQADQGQQEDSHGAE